MIFGHITFTSNDDSGDEEHGVFQDFMESSGHIEGGMRSKFSPCKDESNGKVDSDEGAPFVSFECACCRVTEVSWYRAHS